MSAGAQTPYERLLALGICELDLAREGRLEELAACQQTRAELIAALPATPPADARDALQRALVVEHALETELRAARQRVLAALGEMRRAQRAASGYAPARRRAHSISADA